MIIYVGDSKDVVKRIRTDHCRGNVEASALRKYVAKAKGYALKTTKRPSGSRRVRIDLSDPRRGENEVSDYIHSGEWRYVLCSSAAEAKDFQWYAIDHLHPLLNRERKPWDHAHLQRYQFLLTQLTSAPALNCNQLRNMQSGPGVYVLYHQRRP